MSVREGDGEGRIMMCEMYSFPSQECICVCEEREGERISSGYRNITEMLTPMIAGPLLLQVVFTCVW